MKNGYHCFGIRIPLRTIQKSKGKIVSNNLASSKMTISIFFDESPTRGSSQRLLLVAVDARIVYEQMTAFIFLSSLNQCASPSSYTVHISRGLTFPCEPYTLGNLLTFRVAQIKDPSNHCCNMVQQGDGPMQLCEVAAFCWCVA